MIATSKMLAKLQWVVVPRTVKTLTLHFGSNGCRCLCTHPLFHSTLAGAPLRAPSFNPCRKISCSPSPKNGKADVKVIPKINGTKWKSRTLKPRKINAASIIDSVFEKGTSDALPEDPISQDQKFKDTSVHLDTIRRRAFLSDSVAYRSSSLEILKDREQSYSSVDEGRLERLMEDVSSGKAHLSTLSSSEIINVMSSLSRAPVTKLFSMSGLFLSKIFEVACQNIHRCSDEEFVNVLITLCKIYPSILSMQQCADLENECKNRLANCDTNTMLLVSDWWIYIQRKSPFNRWILSALDSKVEKMTTQNIVQTFYVIGECQWIPSEEFLQRLTDLAYQSLDSLSWNEVGIMCNAYIKSRSRILSRPIQVAVSSRICQEINTGGLDHYNLVTTMRFISRGYFHSWNLFEQIACVLTPHIHDMPFLVPPHVVTAFAKVRHFNQPLMDTVASRDLKTVDSVRLKDAWMLVWSFCRLNYDPPNSKHFLKDLIHYLDRAEISDQPHQFMKSLVALTFIGEYPFNAINTAFSPRGLELYEVKCPGDIYKHLFALDCSVAIEKPEYSGYRLPQEFKDKFWQNPHGSRIVPFEKIRGLQEAVEELQCILGGAQYLKAHPILPHIRTPLDIEVHLDASSNPLPLASKPERSLEELLSEANQKDGIQRLAVLVAPSAHFRLRSKDLLGVHVMKRRQLQKIGYRIVELPYYEWEPLLKASKYHRHSYLKAKMFK